MKPKFTILDPARGDVEVTSDGYVVTKTIDDGWRYALVTPQISAGSPPAYLKIKINKLTDVNLFLGVIGNSSPVSGGSSSDRTLYGFWNGSAYAAGYPKEFPMESYGHFETGDIVVFQLDTTAHTLKMAITRNGGVSTITGLKDIPAYWFYVNLGDVNDQVEVLDMTPSDLELF